MKIKCLNKTTNEEIKNFIVSENCKVYTCSSIGDDVDFDEFEKDNEYNDNLCFVEITDEVELSFKE